MSNAAKYSVVVFGFRGVEMRGEGDDLAALLGEVTASLSALRAIHTELPPDEDEEPVRFGRNIMAYDDEEQERTSPAPELAVSEAPPVEETKAKPAPKRKRKTKAEREAEAKAKAEAEAAEAEAEAEEVEAEAESEPTPVTLAAVREVAVRLVEAVGALKAKETLEKSVGVARIGALKEEHYSTAHKAMLAALVEAEKEAS